MLQYITIIKKVIGDLSENVEAHADWNVAKLRASQLQNKTHLEGYTDFRFICEQLEIEY